MHILCLDIFIFIFGKLYFRGKHVRSLLYIRYWVTSVKKLFLLLVLPPFAASQHPQHAC